MNVTVKKWGNSAAIRIPVSIMEAMRLDIDEVVNMRAEKDRIIIEPTQKKEYDLKTLLEKITPVNLHEAQDTGDGVGKEIW